MTSDRGQYYYFKPVYIFSVGSFVEVGKRC